MRASIGIMMFLGGGLLMLVFETYWFYQWWGLPGAAASIFIPPLAIVFPFVYLAFVGFSPLYFGLWAATGVGIALAFGGKTEHADDGEETQ